MTKCGAWPDSGIRNVTAARLGISETQPWRVDVPTRAALGKCPQEAQHAVRSISGVWHRLVPGKAGLRGPGFKSRFYSIIGGALNKSRARVCLRYPKTQACSQNQLLRSL